MSVSNPQTLEEWDAYFSRYSPKQLMSKARAGNTVEFVQRLKSEGYEMEDIEKIFQILAQKIQAAGLKPPTGAFVMMDLAENDPVGTTTFSEEDFDDTGEPDEVDDMIAKWEGDEED
jgi:hypothetical protein